MGKVVIAGEIGSHLELQCRVSDLVEAREAFPETLLRANDTAALGHQVAHGPLKRTCELLSAS